MLLALVAAASLSGWVPVRWFASDPASLELLRGAPFNCLLLESDQWNQALVAAAHGRRIAVAGIVREQGQAARASGLKLDAIVLEGDPAVRLPASVPVIELLPRRALAGVGNQPVVGTWQGVWPGINPQEGEDGGALAGPTSAPWVDTNSGFLRYLRSRSRARLWIANRPPEGRIYPVGRYLQAMADAALAGARWVVALDRDFEQKLARRENKALEDWKRICAFAAFLEEHGGWRDWPSLGAVGLLQDPGQAAFLSGGVLDMIASQHIPVRPVTSAAAPGLRLVVNLTGKPTAEPGEVAPRPGWKFPIASPDQFAIRQADLPRMEELWKQVSQACGRQNFGVRLFNGTGMLSHPLVSPGGKRLAIPIVNYTGYPVQGVTLHLLGEWKEARLLAPGRERRELLLYPVKQGTALEIAAVDLMAIVEVE